MASSAVADAKLTRPGASAITSAPNRRASIVPGEVIVRFEPGSGAAGTLTAATDELGVARADVDSLLIPRAKVISLDADTGVREAVEDLEAIPGVSYAEPNYVDKLFATRPNDSFYPQTWGLENTGQTINGQPGTPGMDMDAPAAWDYGTGSGDVIVGVIDSGVDLDHRDLSPNLWRNPNETANNGVDDDGNGLVDDVNGWDFSENDAVPNDDTSGHGTHVAGTIGAAGNNGLDNVGVNWDVQLMPLRIGFDLSRSVDVAAGAEAMYYAGQEGASVVNGSYGGFRSPSQLEIDAVRSAPNTLFVFAAGNSDNNNDVNPNAPANLAATEPNVVSVAAIDNQGRRASFSNYGPQTVDLGAPGVDIESTYITPSDVTVSEDPFVENEGTARAYYHTFSTGIFGDADAGGWQKDPDTSNWVIADDEISDPNTLDSWALLDSSVLGPGGSANYANNQNSRAYSPNFSFGGLRNCAVRFYTGISLADAGDRVVYGVSRNGGTSFPFTVDASGPFTFEDQLTYPLGSEFDAATNAQIRVSLTTNASGTATGIAFDTPSIICAAQESVGTHGQISGTSMASPNVAGAAALLASHAPEATGADLEDRLLGSVEPNSFIAPLVSSGGMLNLERLTRPPQATLTGGPSGTTRDTTARFTFELDELNRALGAGTQCKLDSGAWGSCDSTTSHEVRGLSGGSHTFSVRGYWKGYTGDPASQTFTVEGGGGGDSADCKRAKKRLKRAKAALKKAKASGNKRKIRKAKKAVRKAKRQVRKYC